MSRVNVVCRIFPRDVGFNWEKKVRKKERKKERREKRKKKKEKRKERERRKESWRLQSKGAAERQED